MPRTVQITLPPSMTDDVVSALTDLEGILAIRVQRGVSLQPSGDVIGVEVLDRHLPGVMDLAAAREIGKNDGTSLTTSQPLSVVSASSAEAISNDWSEATWEEMDALMGRESNMTLNGLAVMAVAGIVATIGIWQNALHLVIGAMLIAPGFEPIVRTALGAVARGGSWRTGAIQLLESYAALVVGAAAAAVFLLLTADDPRGAGSSYLPSGVLVEYWTTISASSVLIALVAGLAGAVLIAVHRSLLTAGVMVALALVPGAAIAGIGLATADLALSGQGALRWAVDVAMVAIASVGVMLLKLRFVHRRSMSG